MGAFRGRREHRQGFPPDGPEAIAFRGIPIFEAGFESADSGAREPLSAGGGEMAEREDAPEADLRRGITTAADQGLDGARSVQAGEAFGGFPANAGLLGAVRQEIHQRDNGAAIAAKGEFPSGVQDLGRVSG